MVISMIHENKHSTSQSGGFLDALDTISNEMDLHFNEVPSKLLVCFSCFDPRDSFSKFDIIMFAQLTKIYD